MDTFFAFLDPPSPHGQPWTMAENPPLPWTLPRIDRMTNEDRLVDVIYAKKEETRLF